jgi:hypothetical protein
VRVQGETNVETILGKKVPQVTSGGFCMDENPISHWSQWHFVEVKEPLKELPCTDPRVEHGLPEEIDCKLSLWEKQVPEVWRKGGIDIH